MILKIITTMLFISILPFDMGVTFAEDKGDPARGEVLFETCKGCHSMKGYMVVYPNYHVPYIYGQSESYLNASIKLYRDRKRPAKTMQFNVSNLNDKDIADIASFLSNTPTKIPTVKSQVATNSKALQNGQEKYKACVSCHGSNGVSSLPNTPHIAGQYKDYLVRTLVSYKSGLRADPIMQTFVANLSNEDIRDIATYISSMEGPLRTAPLKIAEQ